MYRSSGLIAQTFTLSSENLLLRYGKYNFAIISVKPQEEKVFSEKLLEKNPNIKVDLIKRVQPPNFLNANK